MSKQSYLDKRVVIPETMRQVAKLIRPEFLSELTSLTRRRIDGIASGEYVYTTRRELRELKHFVDEFINVLPDEEYL